MIQAQDILLALRSRLRDNAIKKEYSNNELLDILNMSYTNLATRLNIFTEHIEFDLTDNTLSMPSNTIALLNATYEGKPIDILPLLYLLKNKPNIKNLSISLNANHTLELYPPKDTGKLSIDYNTLKKISSIEDFLELSDYYKEAIIFYCMFLCLQKEMRTDSISKSNYYLSLYEAEINKLLILNSSMNATHDLTTDFVKV